MELMSSLLLCTLAVLTPQALGYVDFSKENLGTNVKTKFDEKQRIYSKVISNISTQPAVDTLNALYTVFKDRSCSNCTMCMKRAIKAHRAPTHLVLRHSLDDLNKETLIDDVEFENREKRNVKLASKAKKSKSNSAVPTKTFSVSKYGYNGKINVLKISETLVNKGNNSKATVCQVYSVKKSYACDSPEADLFLNGKKKAKKNVSHVTTEKTKLTTAMPKKREVDDTRDQDSYMPSIEDLY